MRQKIRKTMLFVFFLLFPVTIWYFSPYLIIQAASLSDGTGREADGIGRGKFKVYGMYPVWNLCG